MFPLKNLGNSRAFVVNIWRKFKKDSLYQLEDVQDLAAHLEHLQSILREFDANGAQEETDFIRYSQEALKPSIQAEIEIQIQEYEDWVVFIQKAVAAKARSALRLPAATKDLDQHCLRGHRPTSLSKPNSQATLQGITLKDSRQKEPKKDNSSQPSQSCTKEPSKKKRKFGCGQPGKQSQQSR